MFRHLLAMVLLILVALPQGVCFCPREAAHESAPDHACCPSDPAPPDDDSEPTDSPDHDCSCKLTSPLASEGKAAAGVEAQRHVAWLLSACPEGVESRPGDARSGATAPTRPTQPPSLEILCAFRI
jgi:hypothetical protein